MSKKFVQNRPKTKGQSHFTQKSVNIGKKRVRFGQNSIFEPIFTFFKKIELFRRKTVRINIFPGGIKNQAKIGQKKKGQSHFAQKKGKKGVLFGQNSIFESVFTFFQKNRVVSQNVHSQEDLITSRAVGPLSWGFLRNCLFLVKRWPPRILGLFCGQ